MAVWQFQLLLAWTARGKLHQACVLYHTRSGSHQRTGLSPMGEPRAWLKICVPTLCSRLARVHCALQAV